MSKVLKRITAFSLSFMMLFLMAIPTFAQEAVEEEIPDEEAIAALVDELVEVARSKKGFYESYINEFTTWYYGVETEAYWCSIFVSWCADQVGALETAVPKRSSCVSMKKWFERKGEYYPAESGYEPQKGDIVFINTAVDGTDSIHHVDIITQSGFSGSSKNKKIKCIGGNTSNINYEGSEYVTEKTRPVNGPRACVVGYAHPSYENSLGVLAAFYSIMDDIMPPYMKYLYSKFISFIGYFE